MLNRIIRHGLGKWLAIAALLGCGLAMAQSEPTLNQIYEAAQSGKLEQAQVMIQQVLVAHPNSGRAHFVQAELLARQGQLGRAREALATAEKLAPGLPFAKPQAVQALRTQLSARNPSQELREPAARSFDTSAPAAPASSFPWGLALALGGGAIAVVIFLLNRKPAASLAPQASYAGQGPQSGGLSGPQSFGMGAGNPAPPAYAPPADSGMGGRLMGGLATGLAVGAGVMAAQAIGKSLMGNNEHSAHPSDSALNNGYEPIANNSNTDMGGQNFGINDASSWDDGSSSASNDGGGDWDA